LLRIIIKFYHKIVKEAFRCQKSNDFACYEQNPIFFKYGRMHKNLEKSGENMEKCIIKKKGYWEIGT
jgi:hypothetical protein